MPQDDRVPAVVWLVVAAALCAGELLTLNLVLLMLGVAALAGAGTALLTGSLALQAAVCAMAATLLLLGVRPVAQRHLEVRALPSGIARLQGRRAVVVEALTAGTGQVRLDGELWRARPFSGGHDVPVGCTVIVAAVEGATLHVYPEELT